MFYKTLAVAGLASMVNGHIIMTNPVPYGNPSNSPLEADGSNFPCKNIPTTGGESNVYAQGSTQQLSFQGTAVHGGGSCQVSVTTDLNPTRDSVWKVIHSIEGGCPAKGQTGNMGNNANAEVPYKYDFTIPDDLAAGDYTFAWTWFNKVGNREMYMNCAPLTVTGSGGDESFYSGLPDMFVANVGNDCGTVGSKDVAFPNPGDSVAKENGATEAFAAPTGSGCQAGGGGSAKDNGGGSPEPAPEPTPAPETPEVPPADESSEEPAPTSTSTISESIPGGVFIAQPTEDSTPEPSTTQTPEQTPVPENPDPVEESPDNGDIPSGGFDAGSSCDVEGAWNCIGGSAFQRCASGVWSNTLKLASGVTCEGGQGKQLKLSSRAGKREMRRAQRLRV